MTATSNAKNLRQRKIRFSLIVEQILAFALHPNLAREIKIIASKFQANLRDNVLRY